MVQFNKMFVMLPVMFLARKLDSEDPNVVHWLRIAYACMQVICVAFVAYTYARASAVKADRVVYVPAPPVVRDRYTLCHFLSRFSPLHLILSHNII